RTEKTETISGLINLTMLPMYLLSGTFFSSRYFPEEMQPFIQALPLTQVNDALREVMLEGHSLTEIAWRLGILMAWALGTFFLALRWFGGRYRSRAGEPSPTPRGSIATPLWHGPLAGTQITAGTRERRAAGTINPSQENQACVLSSCSASAP